MKNKIDTENTIDAKELIHEYEKTREMFETDEFRGLISFGGLWKNGKCIEARFSDGLLVLEKNLDKSEETKNADYFLIFKNISEEGVEVFYMIFSYLYLYKGKNKTYLSGRFGGTKLLIFKNEFHETDRHPVYLMQLAPTKIKRVAKDEDFSLV